MEARVVSTRRVRMRSHGRRSGAGEVVMREEWKAVASLDGFYEVSTLGNVRRTRVASGTNAGHPIVPVPAKRRGGYLTFHASINMKRKTVRIHRIVAEVFIHGFNPVLPVNHKDGCKTNNRAENLEMITPGGNAQHARLHGLLGKLFVVVDGMPVSVTVASERAGISYYTVYDRLKHGWDAQRAVFTPSRGRVRILSHGGFARSVSEWARFLGVPNHLLVGRLRRGWTVADTLTTPWGPCAA